MSTVEAAASLFGPDDSTSDPFASLGTAQIKPTSVPDSATNESHFHSQSTPDASGLFGPEQENPGFFAAEETSQYHPTSEPSTNDPYGHGSAYSQDLSAGDSLHDEAQGWYDQHGQWQNYEQPQVEATIGQQQYGTYNHDTPSSSYDAYAPQTISHAASAYATQSQAYAPQSQSAYNLYQPPVTPSIASHPSTSNATSSASTSYDPYKPTASVSQYSAPQAYPQSNQVPYSSKAMTTPAVPAPPKPSAAPYRPKTSNAYDPPLPPPKPSKRTFSRPARSISPAVGQQTYPAYDSFMPSSPSTATRVAPPPSVQRTYFDSYSPPNGFGASGATPVEAHENWKPLNRSPDSIGYASPSHFDHGQDPRTMPQHLYPSGGHGSQNGRSPPPSSINGKSTNEMRHHGLGESFADHQAHPEITPRSDVSHQYTSQTSSHTHYLAGEDFTRDERPVVTSATSPGLSSGANVSGQLPSEARSRGQSPPPASQIAVSPWGASVYSPGNPRASPDTPPMRVAAAISQPPPATYPGAQTSYEPTTERSSPPISPPGRSWSQSTGHSYVRSRSPEKARFSPSGSKERSRGERASSPGSESPQALNRPSSATSASYVKNNISPSLNLYEPPSFGAERAASPGSTSVRSLDGASHMLYDAHATKGNAITGEDSYQSSGSFVHERTGSPEVMSGARNGSQIALSNPYAPPISNGPARRPPLHGRSMSNGSTYSSTSVTAVDPYAPSSRQQPNETSDYGNYSSRYHYHSLPEGGPYGMAQSPPDDLSLGQEVLAVPTHAAYAPSPSLLGSNDPLGRTSARIPVFSFGFGGKVVTCFHGSSVLNTGFDVALSSRHANDVQIRLLHEVIPESALDTSAAAFPGPLFADPGTPTTTSLVRTGASQTKTKKARVVKYLGERIEELSRGVGYLSIASIDRKRVEGKLALVRLLKVMVENDGRLSGSSSIDAAARAALIPRLKESASGLSSDGLTATMPLTYPSASDLHTPMVDMSSAAYPGLGLSAAELKEIPIAVTTLRPSALDKIQEFLLHGERRKAYHYALDEKLWAHAMVIASSIDKDAWKEAVHDFLKSELGVKGDGKRSNGRESLRVAYSLFSGQGAAAVQQLHPPNLLSKPGSSLQVPVTPMSHVTPQSPNFPPPSVTGSIPIESLSTWAETVAMMASTPLTPESSAALTALGDYLMANQWTEAAHVCYLLAPQTSHLGGAGTPSVRIVLVGSRNPQVWPSFHKDADPIIFSEIVEFALSLTTAPKGQEPFGGLPHLQAYKLVRAAYLAEVGHTQLANRYCEAISSSLSRNSPYIHTPFVEQLRGLSDRLTGAPHVDKSGSWIGGKMTKPSLDSIGNWLEGRFTKFIAGEGEPSPPPIDEPVQSEKPAYVGPFSHYSTISSATPSASPSPQPSLTNLNVLPSSPPPRRSGSAMALHSGVQSHVQIDRASSAMDYTRSHGRKASPGPRIASANATTTTFSQSQSFGQAFNGYAPAKGSPSSDMDMTTPTGGRDTIDEEGGSNQEATWWGSSYGEETNPTPTATTFLRVDDAATSSSSDGFISLMDDSSIIVTPSSPLKNQSHSSHDNDDDDDLGLGNSKRDRDRNGEAPDTSSSTERVEPANATPERPELKSTATGSWISRWWKRGESSPGPIKASLGEEKSFYYDQELKRWVNKNAGEDTAKPALPPPPSRAQTASPGRNSGKPPIGPGPPSSGPPLARPASAIDLSTSPPTKSVPRARSNLVPIEASSTPSPPPTPSSLQPPPPPSRPRSQASKRNVRSRYVDVFQQPEA